MKNYYRNNVTQFVCLAVIIPGFLASFTANSAPVAPDAGQTIRELQQQPELSAPKTTAPLRQDDKATPDTTAADDARVMVKAIRVSGNSVFAAPELDALVAHLVGGEHTLAELEAGAGRITAYYRARGYLVAHAYLPAQDIKDGVLEISVLEGRIGEQHVNNQSRLSDEYANKYLSVIERSDVLQAQPVDRALLLLNDTPGVGGVNASLRPGASVGTTDLVVELSPSARYVANIDFDNYGNRYTGEYRLGGALSINSPLQMGDLFSLRALTSNQDMNYARLSYQVPVGGSGLKLGGAYSDTNYRLGKEFASLNSHGSASSSSLYLVYPFVRSQTTNFSGAITREDKHLNDQVDSTNTIIDKRVQLTNFGLAGNHQDTLGGAGNTSFDLSVVAGSLSMDADSLADDSLPASAHANGSFTRYVYNINRLQRLADKDMLSVAFSGQRASKNLNSSEKFSIGGVNGVRAYPLGEGDGDQGWLMRMELRHGIDAKKQAVLFYDKGAVEINRNPFAAGVANTRSISGAGVGGDLFFDGGQLKIYLAWRAKGGEPVSGPAKNPRLWLQVGKQF